MRPQLRYYALKVAMKIFRWMSHSGYTLSTRLLFLQQLLQFIFLQCMPTGLRLTPFVYAERLALAFSVGGEAGTTGWDDTNAALAWFQAGLPEVPQYIRFFGSLGDETVYLAIADHCIHNLKRNSFKHCPKSLLQNKAYMKKIVAKDISLLNMAPKALRQDVD